MAQRATSPATYADIEALPETLVGEIIDGVLETHPRPRPPHVTTSLRLGGELDMPFGRGRGGPGGWVFAAEPELRLLQNVIVPDLAGWRRERLPQLPETAYFETPPDWVCEILSPSTARLDRGSKRRLYAGAGVEYLWLLDPEQRVLEVFSLTGRQWLLFTTVESGELVKAPPFDAIAFPFNDLFPFDSPPAPSSTEA